jgi:prepilin-type processing-associated H-X9-DG protein
MKPTQSNRRTNALTLTEVLLLMILIALLLSLVDFGSYSISKKKARQAACMLNLRVIANDFRLWEAERDGGNPAATSISGTLELAATGNVAAVFQVVSNELNTPRILFCPTDTNHVEATNWMTGFGNKNISYFVGLDANEKNPNSILAGDDNFQIKGVPVKSGVLEVTTNTPIHWTTARHRLKGNILLADGSVQEATDTDLTNAIIKQYTGRSAFTNRFRLAIP